MHDLLNARKVLVAGGTGNVGRVIVAALLDAGAAVAVPSRSLEKLDRLRAEVDSAHAERLFGTGTAAAHRRIGRGLQGYQTS